MAHRIQVAQARKDFASVVGRSALGERIKVTRYGRTLAAIVSKSDLERLEDCEENHPGTPASEPAAKPRRAEALHTPRKRR
jgi:prevent-host-death family protein